MDAIEIFEHLPMTRDSIRLFTEKMVDEILATDPLGSAVMIKSLSEIIKQLRLNDDVRDHIVSELEKYNGSVVFQGNVIDKAEAGTTYNFEGDDKLNEMMRERDLLNLQIKHRESELKANVNPNCVITKKSTTTYKVRLS